MIFFGVFEIRKEDLSKLFVSHSSKGEDKKGQRENEIK